MLVAAGGEEIAEGLHAYAREGVSNVQIYFDPVTLPVVEAFAPVLEALG